MCFEFSEEMTTLNKASLFVKRISGKAVNGPDTDSRLRWQIIDTVLPMTL